MSGLLEEALSLCRSEAACRTVANVDSHTRGSARVSGVINENWKIGSARPDHED